jgi:RNA polymerase sigma factor (sigma-70 family)
VSASYQLQVSTRIPTPLLSIQHDQRLLALIRGGHEPAFDALVHRHRRSLLRYCRRMRLSEARAEDVVQQAFLQAWQAIERGAEVRDLRAWLYRIVHNVAVGSMRGSSREERALQEVSAEADVPARELDLGAGLYVREALADVAALPDLQREAIVLTAVAGHSHEEAASALGVSNGAVRGLLYRARSTLRGAAAALAPPWLIARWPGSAATTGDAAVEVAAGGGAVGGGGMLIKGVAIALSTGALATGAGVAHVAQKHSHARVRTTSGATVRPEPAAVDRAAPLAARFVPLSRVPRRGSGDSALDREGRGRSANGRSGSSSSGGHRDDSSPASTGASTSDGDGPAVESPRGGGPTGTRHGGEAAGGGGGSSSGGPGPGGGGSADITTIAPASGSSGSGSVDGSSGRGGPGDGDGGSDAAGRSDGEAAPASESVPAAEQADDDSARGGRR